jgi:SAM-dependent methyltransferase
MLYHVPDPARAVAELSRVVRPGGTVLVVLNGADHMDTYRSLVAEAAGRDKWLPIPSDTMNLGHGALLRETFAAVVLDELRGSIVLRDIDPLVRYATSACDFYEHEVDGSWADFETRLAEVAHRHLDRQGRIEITTHSGVFVCTAAA